MDQIPATPFTPQNVVDVAAPIGNVPNGRIFQSPAPGSATEADLIYYCEKEKRLCELIDGTLVEKAMGAIESYLALVLSEYLSRYARENNLGILLGEAGMLRFSPRRVYLPDISFVPWSQDPMRQMKKQAIADLHPDLAVEVLSPSNTKREMKNKRMDYFAWGTRLVWQLDPNAQVMEVFTAPEESVMITISGSLDGGEVLPGFSLPMTTLFENTDRFLD